MEVCADSPSSLIVFRALASLIAGLTDLQDLQLPPAFCLPQDAELSLALEAAYEREFDQLP